MKDIKLMIRKFQNLNKNLEIKLQLQMSGNKNILLLKDFKRKNLERKINHKFIFIMKNSMELMMMECDKEDKSKMMEIHNITIFLI